MTYQQDIALESEQIIKMVARDVIQRIGEPFAFGHAFLWVVYKAGKKTYKTLAGTGACGNWDDIQIELKKACPQIISSYINLD